MFGQAEVYKGELAAVVYHHIGRLHVEMIHIPVVKVAQGPGGLTDIAQGFADWQRSACFHELFQALTFDIVHHIVCGAVFLENVKYFDYTFVMLSGYAFGLLDEFPHEMFDSFDIVRSRNAHFIAERIAVAVIFWEKFLDAYIDVQRIVVREVGDTETAVAQHPDDGVLAVEEFHTLGEGKYVVHGQKMCGKVKENLKTLAEKHFSD